jgi:hypothetical protein
VLQNNGNGGLSVREHTFTEHELQAFLFDAQLAAAEADTAAPTPGAHCKWCRAVAACSGVSKVVDAITSAIPQPGLTAETAPAAMARAAACEARTKRTS